jgi:hypothetical protein
MDIPENWKTLLAAVREVLPDAVIGGGCLRDLDNGREVKDIDIFTSGANMRRLTNNRDELIEAGFDCDEIDPDKLYPIGDGNDVVGHFDILGGVGLPVQIIVVNWPIARIVERFDFGICWLAFDGETLTRPVEYDEDKRDKVFRLRRQRTNEEMVASVHRYARLSRKYEGWRFALYEEDAFGTLASRPDYDHDDLLG